MAIRMRSAKVRIESMCESVKNKFEKKCMWELHVLGATAVPAHLSVSLRMNCVHAELSMTRSHAPFTGWNR